MCRSNSPIQKEQQALPLLTGFLVGGWLWWLGQPAFPLDDAWIVTHAAEHWLGRVPGQFVGAAPLDGATSVVHVTLVAALGLLMPVPVAHLVLAGLATGALVAAAALPVPGVLKRYAGDVAFDRTELTPVGKWLATGVPAEATVLVHDAGRIATLARQPLVDLVGLKTPWVVPLHRKALTGRCPDHAGAALPQIASQSRARYLVLLEQWDQLHHLQDTLREAGWQLQRVDGERGETAYRVYALTPPAH